MERNIKILIVEDEMLIGAKIALFLTELGYEVTGVLPRAEDALPHVLENMPDMALLDVRLKGEMDGIDLANTLHREHQLPIVFLTANTDDDTFNRAKSAKPFAFLPKPFRKTELKRTLELAVSRMELAVSAEKNLPATNEAEEKEAFLLRDRIFLRFKDRMIKILYSDILYVAADRSYCKVVTPDKEYLLTMPMKKFEEMLPIEMFQRTHRSFLVNVRRVDEVVDTHILVGEHELPLSSGFREAFMGRLNAG
jgi:DNA-binding LytR/AlgR family response regulator